MTRWKSIAVASTVWMAMLVGHPGVGAQTRPPADGAESGSSPRKTHRDVAFETADNCLACHNGLVAPSGEDVSIGVAWRASMMANSSRDPYWQASVRREVLDHPTKGAAIENECATCHMPMAHSAARAAGRPGEVFALASSGKGSPDARRLAADGVSCLLCHQIAPDGLGTRESFVGGFVIGTADPAHRTPQVLGPYEVDAGRSAIMRSAAGVTPAAAGHLRESELCATCHTLYTEAFDANGDIVGTLPEQVPYLEWKNSAFARDRSCQSCHMPAVEQTPIASVLGEPRERFGRHTFLGGNFFVLRMLNRFRADLGVVAPASELEATAQATLRQLQSDTAVLSLDRASVSGGQLEADVTVRNLGGHKLPTGYPARRAWLHVTVRDARARVVFESGAVTEDGRIVGNDNDADGSTFEAHHERVDSADEVQIYEAVIADPNGRVTTGLLRATQFMKDNRLLPEGFDKRTADRDIAVHGAAASDPDFVGGQDTVRYRVAVSESAGPFMVDVELRYQPIGYRWAENLRGYDAPEPRRFVGYYDAMAASSSTVVGRASATAR